ELAHGGAGDAEPAEEEAGGERDGGGEGEDQPAAPVADQHSAEPGGDRQSETESIPPPEPLRDPARAVVGESRPGRRGGSRLGIHDAHPGWLSPPRLSMATSPWWEVPPPDPRRPSRPPREESRPPAATSWRPPRRRPPRGCTARRCDRGRRRPGPDGACGAADRCSRRPGRSGRWYDPAAP